MKNMNETCNNNTHWQSENIKFGCDDCKLSHSFIQLDLLFLDIWLKSWIHDIVRIFWAFVFASAWHSYFIHSNLIFWHWPLNGDMRFLQSFPFLEHLMIAFEWNLYLLIYYYFLYLKSSSEFGIYAMCAVPIVTHSSFDFNTRIIIIIFLLLKFNATIKIKWIVFCFVVVHKTKHRNKNDLPSASRSIHAIVVWGLWNE